MQTKKAKTVLTFLRENEIFKCSMISQTTYKSHPLQKKNQHRNLKKDMRREKNEGKANLMH